MLAMNHLVGFGSGFEHGGGNDAFTKLLLHCNGTDASTTFTDSSTAAHTVTPVGNAQIDTAQSRFGGASGLFDAVGDYLQLDGSGDFAFGTGDFTIDFWIRPATVAGSHMLYDGRAAGGSGAYPTIYMSGATLVYHANSGDRIIGGTLAASTNHHIALTRSGTSTRLFIDGSQISSTYVDTTNYLNPASRPRLAAGADAELPFDGWMDEIRVSNGVARWVASFMPPVVAYS